MNIKSMILDFNQVNPSELQSKSNKNVKEEEFSKLLKTTQKNQTNNPKEGTSSDKKIARDKKPKELEQAKKQQAKTDSNKIEAEDIEEIKEIILEDLQDEEKLVEAMEDIAEILGVMPDELEAILGLLQINLTDLLEGDNLKELMIEAYNLQDEIELLEIPGIASDIENIKSILEDIEVDILEEDKADVIFKEVLVDSSKESKTEGNLENTLDTKVLDEKNHLERSNNKLDSDPKQNKGIQDKESIPANESEDVDDFFGASENFTSRQDTSNIDFVENLSQAVDEAFQLNNETVNNINEVKQDYHANTLNSKVVLEQIVDKIKLANIDDNPMMNIQLKPEHLGKLTMEVVSKQGIMTAQFTVESDRTKEILEQNLQQLRDNLDRKGLQIEEIEVTVGQNDSDGSSHFQRPKVKRNISDIIDNIMNEDIGQEEIKNISKTNNVESQVDYTA